MIMSFLMYSQGDNSPSRTLLADKLEALAELDLERFWPLDPTRSPGWGYRTNGAEALFAFNRRYLGNRIFRNFVDEENALYDAVKGEVNRVWGEASVLEDHRTQIATVGMTPK